MDETKKQIVRNSSVCCRESKMRNTKKIELKEIALLQFWCNIIIQNSSSSVPHVMFARCVASLLSYFI